jgi:serine/threonine protein kinase
VYSFAAFARLAGVTVKMLRHYERMGFLTPKRTSANHRRYSIRDLQILERILALKSLGLLHRDIKGRNVLHERGGRIVLMDLGAGRALDGTQTGDHTGTPMYMAPKVLVGGAATARSDIYCLGVLLYRLLTARLPVTAADRAALRAAHARGDRLPLRRVRTDLTPDITTTIERARDSDPSGRYASASEFADTLAAAFQRRVTQHGTVVSSMARRFARFHPGSL